MPVDEKPVHPLTVGGSHYRCHNRSPFKHGYYAKQSVVIFRLIGKLLSLIGCYRMMFIEHRMSRDCRYDISLKDAKCEGCKHRGSGEEYYKKMMEIGI